MQGVEQVSFPGSSALPGLRVGSLGKTKQHLCPWASQYPSDFFLDFSFKFGFNYSEK